MSNQLRILAIACTTATAGGFYHGLISGRDKKWAYCATNVAGGPLVTGGASYLAIKVDPSIKQLGGIAGPATLLTKPQVSVPLVYSLGFMAGAFWPAVGYMLKAGLNKLD